MVLRPDEEANEAIIDRDKRFRSNIGSAVKTGATLAASAVAGPIASRIAPFLSEHIPLDLAIKGISKVSPKVGGFLKKGMEAGLTAESGLDFLKEQLSSKEEPAKQNQSIIEQYSPELAQFLEAEIAQGRSPIEAGALAQMEKSGKKGFKHIIEKMVKDHKTPWSAILQSVYGDMMGGQGEQQQPQQPQPQGQQQPGQGQAQLMQILQKLQQARGG